MKKLATLLCTSSALLLPACGWMGIDSHAPNPQAQDESASGQSPLAAYQSSVFAFATKGNSCAQCHGASQAPLFAVSNISAACNSAVSVVNLSNPSASALAVYAGNGHCGNPAICGGNSAAMAAEIQGWAQLAGGASNPCAGGGLSTGGSSGGSTGGDNGCPAGLVPPSSAITYVTDPMPIPSVLPTEGASTGAIVRWNLDALTPVYSQVGGSIFEIQIESLNAGTYRFFQPKLIVPSMPTEVAGIHVLVKPAGQSGIGCELPSSANWVGISGVANPSTIPNPLPTTPLRVTALTGLDVLSPVQSTDDVVTLGFETIEQAMPSTFTAVNAQILQTTCVSCHNPGNRSGGVDLSTYAGVAAIVTAGKSSTSQLYTSVTTANPLMPSAGSPLNSTQLYMISSWINAGAADN